MVLDAAQDTVFAEVIKPKASVPIPGFRFHWPGNAQEVKELTSEQYAWLMKGFNPLQEGLIGEVNSSHIG